MPVLTAYTTDLEPCLSCKAEKFETTTFAIELPPPTPTNVPDDDEEDNDEDDDDDDDEDDEDNNAESNNKQPDWDGLKAMSSTVRKILLQAGGDDGKVNLDESMLQLALAIKSHPNLEAIHFASFYFEEFGQVGMALLMSKRSSRRPSQPIALRFISCAFDSRAAKSLGFLLQSTDCPLDKISFIDCNFLNGAEDAIQSGLRRNRSLHNVECIVKLQDLELPTARLVQGVSCMLASSEHLTKMTLSIQETSFWDLFRAMNNSNKTLESLNFIKSTIDDSAIDAILMKCFMIPSLKELCFVNSTFETQNSFNLLINAVSEHKILDTLSLDRNYFGYGDPVLQCSFRCYTLQLNKLVLRGEAFCLFAMLPEIANNSVIQSLELGCGALNNTKHAVENLCRSLLVPNRGPSELKIGQTFYDFTGKIGQALSNNTNLTSLDIGDLKSKAVMDFVQFIPIMTGLRKLSMGIPDKGDRVKPFYQALVDSLEQNTTLQTLSLTGVDPLDPIAQQYLPQIRYFLAINRIRRQTLMTVTVPNGIWAHVLAKTSGEAAGINYILTSKADIIGARSRKRKGRDNEGL